MNKVFKKNVTYVMPFIKMKLLYKFQLLWWKNVPLLGLWVCFTCDLFIVTDTMLDVGRISGYHFESRQYRNDSVNSYSNWLSSFREDFRIIFV